MNQREVRLCALRLCAEVLHSAIKTGEILNRINDDTSDDDAERIVEAAAEFLVSLQVRVRRLSRPIRASVEKPFDANVG